MFTCGNEETSEAQGRPRRDLDNSLIISKAHLLHIAVGSDENEIHSQSF